MLSTINRGEIVAKKLGKMYRIPASSLSCMFTGLDQDLFNAQQIDLLNIKSISSKIKTVRKNQYAKVNLDFMRLSKCSK